MLLCSCNNEPSNLIFNGSAEVPGYDSVPKGWQNIDGNWTSAKLDSANDIVTPAQSGNHFFFGHTGAVCILQQDVDVSKYAKKIDEKKQKFILSGFERTLDQGNLSDQGMLKEACLDASKKIMLFSDSTDTVMSKTKWQPIADTFPAPPLTRFIRIQLIAFRHVGNDNDGYFDNISLVAVPSSNYILIIIVIIAVIAAGAVVYFQKKKTQ